ncbi:Fz domain [Nesidiocoris tenuis]|nr:Fz domain [Nesidiocoris tenuis]
MDELTAILYCLTRPRADSIYKTAILSHDDDAGGVVKWRVIRWLVMLLFVLFMLATTIYTVLWLTEQTPKEVQNNTKIAIPEELLINLETQRNVPQPKGLLETEIDIPIPPDDLQTINEREGSLEENKTTSPLDEEVSFIDRLISSFNQGQTRRPTTQPQDPVKQFTSLGETGYVRHLPNGHKYGEYQSVPSMTKFLGMSTTSPRLPVSPTLPSIRPKGYEQSTEGAPSNASDSNCHSPQLAMCRGVIPWDLTSVPSLPGITSLESLKEAMPYFELIIESGCSPRARQFLCSLLEPECMPLGSSVTPPCRTVCKAVAEDCSDFILDVLDLSQVFQCDNYPESEGSCVNLGKGQRCLSNEISCGDETCVPHKWRCNGVTDCLTGADEVNCTTCSNHQFTCASLDRCIPLDWRCDGRLDCPDDSDEKDCEDDEDEDLSDHASHLSPCPSGELRCVDGRCITLAQICDGAKDCSDGADETNCKIPYT